MNRLYKRIRRLLAKDSTSIATDIEIREFENSRNPDNGEVADYWTGHNVTAHFAFADAKSSLEYFDWRNDQYFNYIQLMPVTGQDGKSVLDYGCGPGHDLVGFGIYSNPERLVGVDLSSSSLEEAASRLDLHGITAELRQIMPDDGALPFDDASFDHIHSSGVLHHTPDPGRILREFRRMLRPDGTINVMVYNYDSLWLHLYVAYQRTILSGIEVSSDIREQFRCSTDGESCPISNCYRPQEWIDICRDSGLKVEFIGAAISMHEMGLLPQRFAAVQDRRLRAESRKFLLNLVFDEYGYPRYRGNYAGVDACFKAWKA